MNDFHVLFVQLPVPSAARFAPTGFTPLSCAVLASFIKDSEITAEILDMKISETRSDQYIISRIMKRNPSVLALSLYLWNSERSVFIAQELKKKNPDMFIFAGGPEVSRDNPWLIRNRAVDLFFTGESELLFRDVIRDMSRARSRSGIIKIINKYIKLNSSMNDAVLDVHDTVNDLSLIPHGYGYSPWQIPPDPERTFYLETARGCASHCSYCFYPRFETKLRTLGTEEVIRRIEELISMGAKEIAFLDSTFNRRPGFAALLQALIRLRKNHKINFFAEMRGEDIDPATAALIRLAGFTRIEIGIQSFNKETLLRNGRPSDPERALQGAYYLKEQGIELLIDIMAGLPGDSPADVFRALKKAKDCGLSDYLQIFPVSVLPGTSLRNNAQKEGVTYQGLPPYHITETKEFSSGLISQTLLDCEEILERPLEDFARINFTETQSLYKTSSKFHQSYVIDAGSGSRFEDFAKTVQCRINDNPFSVFDFILKSSSPFPLKLAEEFRDFLESQPGQYLSRSSVHPGINLQRRLCILLPADCYGTNRDWIHEALEITAVYLSAGTVSVLNFIDKYTELPETLRFLITDIPSEEQLHLLAEKWIEDYVSFADRKTEIFWTLNFAGFTEVKYERKDQ